MVEESQGFLDELLGHPKVDDKPLVVRLATQHNRDDGTVAMQTAAL